MKKKRLPLLVAFFVLFFCKKATPLQTLPLTKPLVDREKEYLIVNNLWRKSKTNFFLPFDVIKLIAIYLHKKNGPFTMTLNELKNAKKDSSFFISPSSLPEKSSLFIKKNVWIEHIWLKIKTIDIMLTKKHIPLTIAYWCITLENNTLEGFVLDELPLQVQLFPHIDAFFDQKQVVTISRPIVSIINDKKGFKLSTHRVKRKGIINEKKPFTFTLFDNSFALTTCMHIKKKKNKANITTIECNTKKTNIIKPKENGDMLIFNIQIAREYDRNADKVVVSNLDYNVKCNNLLFPLTTTRKIITQSLTPNTLCVIDSKDIPNYEALYEKNKTPIDMLREKVLLEQFCD